MSGEVPLTLLAGDTSPWPDRAPSGKPNTARVSTPPLCRCLQDRVATRVGSGNLVRAVLFPLDPKDSLQLPDLAPHLEPPARRQAQVGALVWSLEGIDPRVPQPGLKDLTPELLFVSKLHLALFRSSRNLASSIRKLHRFPGVWKGIMSTMNEDPTLTPWRRLGETLEGSFAARARGLLAPDFAILGREGEEIGHLEIHGAEGSELEAGDLEARIERSFLCGYTMLAGG